jgi:hypothetical protein
MVDKFLSRPVAYYAYLLNIFNSFLRVQNSGLLQQKRGFSRSSIMELSVGREQFHSCPGKATRQSTCVPGGFWRDCSVVFWLILEGGI